MIDDEKPNILIPTSLEGMKMFSSAIRSMVQEVPQKKLQDPRKQKIRDLKQVVKTEQDLVTELLGSLDVKKESELTSEEQEKNKETFKDTLSKHRLNIKTAQEDLKAVRENKTGSSFFEVTPHKGMNRRTARTFRRNNK